MSARTFVLATFLLLLGMFAFGIYIAGTSGKTTNGDQRLSEFHPAPGVVCYAFSGVPQSLSCVRMAP